jgi:hypothetical protein
MVVVVVVGRVNIHLLIFLFLVATDTLASSITRPT